MASGYKIVINKAGKKQDNVVARPEHIFDSYAEVDEYMDRYYPNCWYSSELVEKPENN